MIICPALPWIKAGRGVASVGWGAGGFPRGSRHNRFSAEYRFAQTIRTCATDAAAAAIGIQIGIGITISRKARVSRRNWRRVKGILGTLVRSFVRLGNAQNLWAGSA